MKKKSKLRRILPWVGFAVLALVLALLPRLARSVETGEKASILTATAVMGEVENTLGGGGTLTAEDPVEIEIPASVEIEEFLVDNGDHVEAGQPVAIVDRVTLLSAISEVQKSIDILTEKMLLTEKTQIDLKNREYSRELSRVVEFSWIESQAVGRVKAIYAQVGDDVAQVVTDNGALVVVSIDGLLVTKVPTDLPIKAGEKLIARLSDGQEVPARVETKLVDVLTVILSDQEPSVGEEVTVLTKDGTEVGTGILDVHSPWNVIATQGVIANIVVTENQMVYAGTKMVCLRYDDGNDEYRSLVTKRRQYEDLMTELFALYTDDTIKAPETGFITGVDKSIIKSTAALDKKPILKLLAKDVEEKTEAGNHSIFIVKTNNKNEVEGIQVDGNLDEENITRIYLMYILGINPAKVYQLPVGRIPVDYQPKDYDLITLIDDAEPSVDGDQPLVVYGNLNFKKLIDDINSSQNNNGAYGDYGDFTTIGGGEAQNDELFPRQKKTALAVIPDSSMTVTMSVDELDIPYYELGQKADVQVDALPNQSFSAVVEEISAVGRNSGGNSKYTVKLRLDRAPDMLNGMNASVVVHRGVTTGLVLPAAAVYDRGSQCFVYTAADNKTGTLLGELPVVTGVSDGEMVEIVSGLAEGQPVFYEYYLPVEEGN